MDGSVLQQICNAQQQTPQNIAVKIPHTKKELTYKELWARSSKIAQLLQEKHGVQPGNRVGVLLGRTTADLIPALLGIWMAKAAYIPLDPMYPASRLEMMIQDGDSKAIITERKYSELIAQKVPSECVLLVDQEEGRAGDLMKKEIPNWEPEHFPKGNDLAYLIFTSGSTGRPKGVAIRHLSVENVVRYFGSLTKMTSRDQILAVTTVCFDIAVLELWMPLCCGACIVMANKTDVMDPLRLSSLLHDFKITVMQATPTTWTLLMSAGWKGSSMLTALCGGEAMPDRIRRELPCLVKLLYNCYGPTETTVWSLVGKVKSVPDGTPTLADIGVAIDRTTCHVLSLDEDHALHPLFRDGDIGELAIGGAGVAVGYWKDPEKTHTAFVDANTIPLSEEERTYFPDEAPRIYRTGDVVRIHHTKDEEDTFQVRYEYLGRKDAQVKIRGFRVELGEIEAVIDSVPVVEKSICLVRNELIVAVVKIQTDDGEGSSTLPTEEPFEANVEVSVTRTVKKAIATSASGVLPQYMHPTVVVFANWLPQTLNGKIDRKAVRQHLEESMVWSDDGVCPLEDCANSEMSTLEKLLSVCADVLPPSAVTTNNPLKPGDSIFHRGGDSLTVLQLISKASKHPYNLDINLEDVFSSATLGDLATALDAKGRKQRARLSPTELATEPVESAFATTAFQQSLLLQLDSEATHDPFEYYEYAATILDGGLNVDALCSAVSILMECNVALRIRYQRDEDGATWIQYPSQEPCGLERVSIALPAADCDLPTALKPLLRKPLDIAGGSLCRFTLIEDSSPKTNERFVLLLTVHHSVVDGWSMRVLASKLERLYNECHTSSLLEKSVEIDATYKAWCECYASEESCKQRTEHLKYWEQNLRGASGYLNIPTDVSYSGNKTAVVGKNIEFCIDVSLSRAIKDIAQSNGTTPFVVLTGVWYVLLSRYSGQDDLCIGTPLAGRNDQRYHDTVGCFINVVPLRFTEGLNALSFPELIQEVHGIVSRAQLNGSVSISDILSSVPIKRFPDRNPLYQAMINFDEHSFDSLKLRGVQCRPVRIDDTSAKLDLSLYVRKDGNAFRLRIQYNSSIFSEDRVKQLKSSFLTIVTKCCQQKQRTPVDILELITPDMLKAALSTSTEKWNRVEAAVATCDSLAGYTDHMGLNLERACKKFGDSVAVIAGDEHITYQELLERSERIRTTLLETVSLSVTETTCVGVLLERGLDAIVAIQGVMMAGLCFVPIDPSYPAHRIRLMLEKSNTRAIISAKEFSFLYNQLGEDRPVVLVSGGLPPLSSTQLQPEGNKRRKHCPETPPAGASPTHEMEPIVGLLLKSKSAESATEAPMVSTASPKATQSGRVAATPRTAGKLAFAERIRDSLGVPRGRLGDTVTVIKRAMSHSSLDGVAEHSGSGEDFNVPLTTEHVKQVLTRCASNPELSTVDSNTIESNEEIVPNAEESGNRLNPNNHSLGGSKGQTGRKLAYIIFTSGSTGQPKGAMISHGTAFNQTATYVAKHSFCASDRVLIVSTLSHSLTEKNIFAALMVGGTVVLAPDGEFDPSEIAGLIGKHRVTWMNSTPSVLAAVVQCVEDYKQLQSLRHVFVGGEPSATGRTTLNNWLTSTDCNSTIVNTYGNSECTGSVAFYENRKGDPLPLVGMPIGDPVLYSRAVVISQASGGICPPGIPGELCIIGAAVGDGYVGEPQLTGKVFVDSLSSFHFPSEPWTSTRMYKTGDIAVYRNDFDIQVCGRADNMVKIRGFRVELGELECVVRRHLPEVQKVVASCLSDDRNEQHIVLYVTPKRIDTRDVAMVIREELPSYMSPSHILKLDSMPITLNGKLDRMSLPIPDWHGQTTTNGQHVSPKTKTEEIVQQVWEDFLNFSPISVKANVFELGATSLSAGLLTARLRKKFGVNLPGTALFLHSTIEAISKQIDDELTSSISKSLENVDFGPGFTSEGVQQNLVGDSAIASLENVIVKDQQTERPARDDTTHEHGGSKRTRIKPHDQSSIIVLFSQFLGLILSPTALRGLFYAMAYVLIHYYVHTGEWMAYILIPPMLMAFGVSFIVGSAIIKWALLGRSQPGVYPLWGSYYLRWWAVNNVWRLLCRLVLPCIKETIFINWVLRLHGCKISRSVLIDTTNIADPDLVTIGENTTIERDVRIVPHRIVGGTLVLEQIDIGSSVRIDPVACLPAGCKVPDSARVRSLSTPREKKWTTGLNEGQYSCPTLRTSLSTSILHFFGVVWLSVIHAAAHIPAFELFFVVWNATGDGTYPTSSGAEDTSRLPSVAAVACFLPYLEMFVIPNAYFTGVLLTKIALGGVEKSSGNRQFSRFQMFKRWLYRRFLDSPTFVTLMGIWGETYIANWYYRALGARIGKRVLLPWIDQSAPELLRVGDDVALGGIKSIIAADHETSAPVTIEDGAIVTNSVVLLPGVTVKTGATIGDYTRGDSGQVFPQSSTWQGAPALLLRENKPVITQLPVPGQHLKKEAPTDSRRNLAPPKRRLCFQLLSFACRLTVLPLVTSSSYAVSWTLTVIILGNWGMWGLFLVPFAFVVADFISIFVFIACKWLFVYRFTEGGNLLGASWHYVAWSLLVEIYLNTPVGGLMDQLRGSAFICWVYRMLGASVGRNVALFAGMRVEMDLLRIDDFACIGDGVILQGHTISDHLLSHTNTEIGKGAYVGAYASILPGAVIEPFSSLAEQSLILQGDVIHTHQYASGLPATVLN